MKYKILASVLLFSSFASAQISINEMKNFLKMDLDNFENQVLNKGFEFTEIKNDENIYGITFKKGHSLDTKYISLYEKFFTAGKSVEYQTSLKSDYLFIKNQLISQNFKLIVDEVFNGHWHKIYKNKNFIVELYSGKNEDNVATYEISISYK